MKFSVAYRKEYPGNTSADRVDHVGTAALGCPVERSSTQFPTRSPYCQNLEAEQELGMDGRGRRVCVATQFRL